MLAPEQVAGVVEAFALGTRPAVTDGPIRGGMGQVWRVDTSLGTWAVKLLFERAPEQEARRSAEFQEAAVAAGVPAPAVVRTVDGTVTAEVAGRQWRVYSWVDLHPPDIGLSPAAVGALVARLHRLRYPAGGPAHPWFFAPVGAQRWHELVAGLQAAGCPVADGLAEQRDELCALEELLAPMSPVQRLHLDLWADNLRATPTGSLCVIDWDNCGPGEPRQELAAVLFEYCSWSPERARALHQAYVEAGGPARITSPADFSMTIAQLGHIVADHCEKWLGATTEEGRSFAEAGIAEAVERPLTRGVVDRLVDAVT